MRPIDRGTCPVDASSNAIVFSPYGYARPFLVNRLGRYCSFCESFIASPETEHVRSKSTNELLETKWENFLLACKPCNTRKSKKIDTLADLNRHIWPDQDRTYEAFSYHPGGVVKIAHRPDPDLVGKATSTAALVGLLVLPGDGLDDDQVKKETDPRWRLRGEVWDEAIEALDELVDDDCPRVRKWIVKTAKARGFFSIWITVFRDDAAMVADLIGAFPGTASDRILPLPSTASP